MCGSKLGRHADSQNRRIRRRISHDSPRAEGESANQKPITYPKAQKNRHTTQSPRVVSLGDGRNVRPIQRDSDYGIEGQARKIEKTVFRTSITALPQIPLFSPTIFVDGIKYSKLDTLCRLQISPPRMQNPERYDYIRPTTIYPLLFHPVRNPQP
jgi:hypothetical protein